MGPGRQLYGSGQPNLILASFYIRIGMCMLLHYSCPELKCRPPCSDGSPSQAGQPTPFFHVMSCSYANTHQHPHIVIIVQIIILFVNELESVPIIHHMTIPVAFVQKKLLIVRLHCLVYRVLNPRIDVSPMPLFQSITWAAE